MTTAPQPDPSLLIDVKVVSKMLYISTRSVWRMVAAKDLPKPISLGRSRRWPRAVIEKWVADKAKAARP